MAHGTVAIDRSGVPMTRTLLAAIALHLSLAAGVAWAADPVCEARADEKKLAGAARTSFVKKCEADRAAAPTCDAQADQKKLAGAARTSFVKKCQSDASAAITAGCEGQADDRKLAGAARTSFVKKCVEDAGGRS
jgi:hypothetical protein